MPRRLTKGGLPPKLLRAERAKAIDQGKCDGRCDDRREKGKTTDLEGNQNEGSN